LIRKETVIMASVLIIREALKKVGLKNPANRLEEGNHDSRG
jgi:hypothetical protein